MWLLSTIPWWPRKSIKRQNLLRCRRPSRLSFAVKSRTIYYFLSRYIALLGEQASKSGYVENYVCSASILSLSLQTFRYPVILAGTAISHFPLKIVFTVYTWIDQWKYWKISNCIVDLIKWKHERSIISIWNSLKRMLLSLIKIKEDHSYICLSTLKNCTFSRSILLRVKIYY